MENFESEISSDEESQLLAKFIRWWICIHQHEQWRVEILELHAHLDQRYDLVPQYQEEVARHQHIIDQLSCCLNNLVASQYIFMLDGNVLDYLSREVSRSLSFESVISQIKQRERLRLEWDFFGVRNLSMLKCKMEYFCKSSIDDY